MTHWSNEANVPMPQDRRPTLKSTIVADRSKRNHQTPVWRREWSSSDMALPGCARRRSTVALPKLPGIVRCTARGDRRVVCLSYFVREAEEMVAAKTHRNRLYGKESAYVDAVHVPETGSHRIAVISCSQTCAMFSPRDCGKRKNDKVGFDWPRSRRILSFV